MHTKLRWDAEHDSRIQLAAWRRGAYGGSRVAVNGSFVGMSHFAAMALYSALVAGALACLTQRTTAARFRYAAITFSLFILVGVGIAWLMYPLSR
ncbi:MAG: hypothetical protein WA823_21350 [Candidatus Acidiferrales bacterium]